MNENEARVYAAHILSGDAYKAIGRKDVANCITECHGKILATPKDPIHYCLTLVFVTPADRQDFVRKMSGRFGIGVVVDIQAAYIDRKYL